MLEGFYHIFSVILFVCAIGIGIMVFIGLLYLLCWFPEVAMVVFVVLCVIGAVTSLIKS